jgi:S-adenosylmethionine uptake transporter
MNALWMVAAALLFSLMGVCIKLAGRHYGIAEIVFYRSLFGALSLAAFVRWRGFTFATPLAGTHIRRGVFGVAALALWFYATMALPLGTAMTLNYTSPLFLAAFLIGVTLRRGDHVDWKLVGAVAIGFVGVVLVLQPSFSDEQTVPAIAGLLSGVLSAAAYWYVRELGQLGEPEWRTVFYFSLTGTLLGLAGSLVSGFSSHNSLGALLLVGVGVSATLAQLAMTRAYSHGHTLVVANLQFSAVVFASALGVAFFGDRIPLVGWLGIAVIIASGISSTVLTARRLVAAKTGAAAETTTRR